jgi:hypothetical protein
MALLDTSEITVAENVEAVMRWISDCLNEA